MKHPSITLSSICERPDLATVDIRLSKRGHIVEMSKPITYPLPASQPTSQWIIVPIWIITPLSPVDNSSHLPTRILSPPTPFTVVKGRGAPCHGPHPLHGPRPWSTAQKLTPCMDLALGRLAWTLLTPSLFNRRMQTANSTINKIVVSL